MAARTPTSLTVREQDCVKRSVAHATKCQFNNLPRGNPGEANRTRKLDPARLEVPPPETSYQSLEDRLGDHAMDTLVAIDQLGDAEVYGDARQHVCVVATQMFFVNKKID